MTAQKLNFQNQTLAHEFNWLIWGFDTIKKLKSLRLSPLILYSHIGSEIRILVFGILRTFQSKIKVQKPKKKK